MGRLRRLRAPTLMDVFGRIRRWAVRHKVLVDAIAVSPLLLFSLATVPTYTGRPEYVPALVCVAFTLTLLLPLVLRRAYPLSVFAFISFVSFGQWLADVEALPANLGVLVGMFTVAAHRRLGWAVAALLTAELGVVLTARQYDATLDALLRIVAFYGVFVAALWVGGLYTNMRRSYLNNLEERAERLEQERDARAQVAAAEERERIARELHDVVAHNVSVMVVQADGASYVIDHNPDSARSALEAISRTGREALTEMRRLLGVLRGTGPADGFTPQPGIDELPDLVGQVRAAGLPVEFRVEGTPRPLDHGAGLAAYRIVQEALTNTLKHAGPLARAEVRVHYGDDLVQLWVDDDGRGLVFGALDNGDGHDGSRHGLVGMRERAAMLGGRLEAGPRPGGGYRVVAGLPMRDVS